MIATRLVLVLLGRPGTTPMTRLLALDLAAFEERVSVDRPNFLAHRAAHASPRSPTHGPAATPRHHGVLALRLRGPGGLRDLAPPVECPKEA